MKRYTVDPQGLIVESQRGGFVRYEDVRESDAYAVAMRAALDKAQTALRDGDIGAARNIIFAARHDAALAKNPMETPSQFHSTQCTAQAKCPTRYACHRSGKCLMATEPQGSGK